MSDKEELGLAWSYQKDVLHSTVGPCCVSSCSSFSIAESTSARGNDRNTCKPSTHDSRLQALGAEGRSLR